MKRILALLVVLLSLPALAFAPNDVSSGCRAPWAPLPWSAIRGVPPYTGTDDLFGFTIDVCSGVKYQYRAERTNTNLQPIDDPTFVNFGCWIDVYLEVGFGQFEHMLGFPTVAPSYTATNWLQTFDGVIDFAGPSGVTINVQDALQANAPFGVDPEDEGFFRQPFNVLISARALQVGDLGMMPAPPPIFLLPVPVNQAGGAGGPIIEDDGQAAAAVQFRWNVLSRTGW